MSERIRELQLWLNRRGTMSRHLVDGRWGPLTRQAVIETFRNLDAPAATPAAIAAIAAGLGASERQLRAVAEVEGGGSGWDRAGLLACLYERHYLWRRVRVAVPFLSNPRPGGYTIDADGDGINDSWEKLADATGRFGLELALECASFGKFQIMGAHWKALGYRSAADFVSKLAADETAHYDAFARFIRTNGLAAALCAIDGNPINARAFARGYNGRAYAKHAYDTKIAAAWRRMA